MSCARQNSLLPFRSYSRERISDPDVVSSLTSPVEREDHNADRTPYSSVS
ncbi:hypothetical protein DM2_1417 [Halorubrum sp. DM2]|nr:hypothetical protein DM2_1417 [Halorubrum sp. DM2]